MRIETLYDSGTARHQEDCHLVQPPFLVVADGVSPPYSRSHPLLVVDGCSAGAVAARVVCNTFAVACLQDSADAVLKAANQALGSKHKEWGRLLDQPDLLAGVSVVAVRISDQAIEIVQVADAIALWSLKSGEVGATDNSVYDCEARLRSRFAGIRAGTGGDRDEAWEKYYPVRCASIREHVNRLGVGNYSVLNGQPEVELFFQRQKFRRDEVSELILCSDGLVPFASTRDPRRLATQVFSVYHQGGLQAILAETREIERAAEASSHESRAEATAIAVRF